MLSQIVELPLCSAAADSDVPSDYGGLNRDHAGVVDGGVLRGGVGLARGRLGGLNAPSHLNLATVAGRAWMRRCIRRRIRTGRQL